MSDQGRISPYSRAIFSFSVERNLFGFALPCSVIVAENLYHYEVNHDWFLLLELSSPLPLKGIFLSSDWLYMLRLLWFWFYHTQSKSALLIQYQTDKLSKT